MLRFLIRGILVVAMVVVPGVGVAQRRNESHEMMQGLPEGKRQEAFLLWLRASNKRCDAVTQTFFQGASSNGNAFWSVACRDGSAYAVQIVNDAEGSTRIMDCAKLKAVGGGECFKPLAAR